MSDYIPPELSLSSMQEKGAIPPEFDPALYIGGLSTAEQLELRERLTVLIPSKRTEMYWAQRALLKALSRDPACNECVQSYGAAVLRLNANLNDRFIAHGHEQWHFCEGEILALRISQDSLSRLIKGETR